MTRCHLADADARRQRLDSRPTRHRSWHLPIQLSLFTDMRPFDAIADVMLLLVLASGMVAGPRTARLCGFFIGVVYDLMLRTPFGLSALTYALIGYAAGYLQAVVSSAPWWIGMLIMGAASAVAVAGYAAVGSVFGLKRRHQRPSDNGDAGRRIREPSAGCARAVGRSAGRCWARSAARSDRRLTSGATAAVAEWSECRPIREDCGCRSSASWSSRSSSPSSAGSGTCRWCRATSWRRWRRPTRSARCRWRRCGAASSIATAAILADNDSTLNVTIDRAAIKDKAVRTSLFERLAGPLKTTPEELQKRYDERQVQPLRAAAARRERRRVDGRVPQGTARGLPGSRGGGGLPAQVPLRPARQPDRRLHGRHLEADPGPVHAEGLPAERPRRRGRRRADLRGASCGASPATSSTPSTPATASSVWSRRSTRCPATTCSSPSTSSCSSTPSRSCRPASSRRAPTQVTVTGNDLKPVSTGQTFSAPAGAAVIQDPEHRRGPGHGVVPHLRQPVVRQQHLRREDAAALPGRTQPAGQPRHLGAVRHRLDDEAVHLDRRAAIRPVEQRQLRL